jgi:predicted lipoprotein with Yx(FWY)xxD motif
MDGRNGGRNDGRNNGVMVTRQRYSHHWRLASAVGAAALALLAACSSNNSSSTTTTTASMAPTSNATSTTAPISGVVDLSRSGTHGVVLVSRTGATLYRYAPDGTGPPRCTGACATAWPPLTVPAGSTAPTAGSGVTSADLGMVTRSDGALQVTYKKMPLYTYVGDSTSGQTNGQGVGGIWFVVPMSDGNSTGSTGITVAPSTTKPNSGY